MIKVWRIFCKLAYLCTKHVFFFKVAPTEIINLEHASLAVSHSAIAAIYLTNVQLGENERCILPVFQKWIPPKF